jgi:cysteine desulfurase
MKLPIYLDNHATTPVDPRVLEAMLPFFTEQFGNAASTTHSFGWDAKAAVEQSRRQIAAAVGATDQEIIFTSGATESNNLAIRGVAEAYAQKGKHIIGVTTEHPSVLEPLTRLSRQGFEVTLLPVCPASDERAGCLLVEQVSEAIRPDTILVSVMFANNEIGAIQPVAEVGTLCRHRGVWFHCDATQAVGKLPVNVAELNADLMSFTAHKLYGPKGIGALYVRRGSPPLRLIPLLEGGGHEVGLRSGTLNVPGIVGFARAVELAVHEMPTEQTRLRQLRDRLFQGLNAAIPDIVLNGPALHLTELRLPGNLNVRIPFVDAETLLLHIKDVALSSGSACTSAQGGPSHVLLALGLSEVQARTSLRFGLGRFNSPEEIEYVIHVIAENVKHLRRLGGWE